MPELAACLPHMHFNASTCTKREMDFMPCNLNTVMDPTLNNRFGRQCVKLHKATFL